MHFPDHHIRTYCRYLGSFTFDDTKWDFGVYEAPDGTVSHAIVYGPEPEEYISGEIKLPWGNLAAKVNKILYQDYLEEKEFSE